MSRTPLVIGALVVLAAAVALVIMLGVSDDSAPATSSSDTSARPVIPPPLDRNASVTVTDRPRMPAGSEPSLPPAGENPREYAVGDIHVRDHRAGDNKPLDIPPNVHPADARMIPSTLTHAISQKVKAVMKECMADVPREGRGAKPRLEGQIIIAIKNKSLAVAKSTIQMRDLEGVGATAVDAAKQCVESRAIGLDTPAPDEADLDSYSINLSFAIPPS